LISPSDCEGVNGVFAVGYRIDGERRNDHALCSYGFYIIDSNEAKNLSERRLFLFGGIAADLQAVVEMRL